MVANGVARSGLARAPAAVSLPNGAGATGTQLEHPSSMAPLQLSSTPSHVASLLDPAIGLHVPTMPAEQAATLFTQAPRPQVNVPRPLSIWLSQSSSALLHASPLGVTSPEQGVQTPAVHA